MWLKWLVHTVGDLTGNPITTALVIMLGVIVILGVLEKFIWSGEDEE